MALGFCALISSCSTEYRGEGSGQEWTQERSVVDARIVSLLDQSRFEEALVLADSILTGGLRDPRILGQKAQALGALGKHEESVTLFEEAILDDYEGCENHLNFAVLLMRMGKTGRAITEFMEAKRFCGLRNLSVINRNLAVGNISMGKNEKAQRYVKEGLEFDPNDPYLLGLMGMLIADAHPVEAESLFVRSQTSEDAQPEFLFQYALLLLKTGRAPDAVKALEFAISMRPSDLEIREVLGEALDRAGRSAEAEQVLRELVGQRRLPTAEKKLARVLFRQGRFEEALALFQELPRSAEVCDRMAMCFHGLGRLDEALEMERESLEMKPNWTVAMVNLAVILAARGELDDAASVLERVLEIDPANKMAKVNLDRLKKAMEDTQ